MLSSLMIMRPFELYIAWVVKLLNEKPTVAAVEELSGKYLFEEKFSHFYVFREGESSTWRSGSVPRPIGRPKG